MKNYMLILCAGIILESCTKSSFVYIDATAISIVMDTTDYHKVYPTADPILALYGFDQDINKEAYFRLSCISDKQLAPVTEFHLAGGEETEKKNKQSIPNFRENHVLMFYEKIRVSIIPFSVLDTFIESDYSECYRTIVNETKWLIGKTTGKKVLIIYSDLMENSDLFNFYELNIPTAKFDSEKIASSFDSLFALPDNLNGLQVYFVYQPTDRIEDARYRAISGIYKQMFEYRGASVTIQSDNDNYE